MKVLIITGPTASGKSGVSIKLANYLKDAEIISADAFQVYRGLDIGTAKIPVSDRKNIPHHLIDILNPDERYTAGLFAEYAEKLISDIYMRGNIPIVAGGAGLYVKALTDGIFNCPEIDSGVVFALNEQLKKNGLASLYSELYKIDPEYAARISSNDPARIMRALEVSKSLGIPFSAAHKLYAKKPAYEYKIMIIARDRKTLYNDINERTKAMWHAGWVAETRTLLSSGYKSDCPAFRAIGYKETISYIKNGGNEDDFIEEIAKETRHFAKRQVTWFKNVKDASFYDNADKLFSDAVEFCNSIKKGDYL